MKNDGVCLEFDAARGVRDRLALPSRADIGVFAEPGPDFGVLGTVTVGLSSRAGVRFLGVMALLMPTGSE
jgi:hypothetical protein